MAVHLVTEWEEVEEAADHAVSARAGSITGDGADHNFLLSSPAVKQDAQSSEQQGKKR